MFPLIPHKSVDPQDIKKLQQHLRQRHGDFRLFIATPCNSNFTVEYTISLYNSTTMLTQLGIHHEFGVVQNGSIIDQARNTCVWKFLRSDCTHMMFIDSDISWTVQNLWDVLWHAPVQKCIMGATYPKKIIDFSSMIHCDAQGRSAADHTGLMDAVMFHPIDPNDRNREHNIAVDLSQPVLVKHLPMGFVMIGRDVFEHMQLHRPQDLVGEPGYVNEQCLFFQTLRVPEIGPNSTSYRYWGEDLVFCDKARHLGIDTYVLPWITLTHVGKFYYRQDLMFTPSNFTSADSGQHNLANTQHR